MLQRKRLLAIVRPGNRAVCRADGFRTSRSIEAGEAPDPARINQDELSPVPTGPGAAKVKREAQQVDAAIGKGGPPAVARIRCFIYRATEGTAPKGKVALNDWVCLQQGDLESVVY